MSVKRALLLSCAGIALSMTANAAFAQDQEQQAAAANDGTNSVVEDVVVTSGKRAQNLQDVPAAVSAFTTKERDTLGIATIQDLTNFTPGLSYNTALDRVSIRGIGRNTNNLTADPGVATYVDGVYNAQTFNAGGDPLFIERIEVLRGPEGTLYGRNSIGGAINAISRRPSDTFNGEVRGGVGSYQRSFLEGTVTGPINDAVRYRFNGNYTNQSKGYFHSTVGLPSEGGNTNSWYVEGQLEADIGENLDAWLKVSDRYFKTGTRSTALVGELDAAFQPTGTSGPGANYVYCANKTPSNPVGCTAGVPLNVVTLPGASGTNPTAKDLRAFQSTQTNSNENKDNWQVSTQVTYHFPIADLKYIGGYQHYYLNLHSGFFNTGALAYDIPCTVPGCTPIHISTITPNFYLENKDFWSNEINLTSTTPGPFQWIAGLYHFGESYHQPVNYDEPGNTFLPLVQLPDDESPDPVRSIDYYNTVNKGVSYAAFGQIDWEFVPKFKLTAGIRYTYDRKHGEESTRQLFASAIPALGSVTVFNLTPGCVPGYILTCLASNPPVTKGVEAVRFDTATGIGYRKYDDNWNAVTGTGGLQWTPNEDTTLYAKYSRGYKSGGFNTGFLAANAVTEPEYVNAYEVGYKGIVASQLRINSAIYQYDYLNDQIPLSVSVQGGPLQTQFFNLPKVRARGFELEAIWSPTSALTFMLAYDYAEATIKSVMKDGKIQCFSDSADARAYFSDATFPNACSALASPLSTPTQPSVTRAQDLTGASLPQTPKNKVSLNGQYRIDMADRGDLTLSANYIWKDETYSSIFNRFYNLAPSYSQTDIRALWTDREAKNTVIFFVKNVFDQLGYEAATGSLLTNSYYSQTLAGQAANPQVQTAPVLNRSYTLTPPRTFGVELQHRF